MLFDDISARHRGANERRRWPIVVVFIGIVALQWVVAALSIDVMSEVRAYVTGESLYSKGQKDAHIHLLGYLERRVLRGMAKLTYVIRFGGKP